MSDIYSTRWLRDHLVALIDRVDALEAQLAPPTTAAATPEWRKRVIDVVGSLRFNEYWGWKNPLSAVMALLAEIADDTYVELSLARIVAVCEAQVGDGWQADPDVWPMTPNLTTLLMYLTDPTGHGEPKWQHLANAAAAWLRDLCNADS